MVQLSGISKNIDSCAGMLAQRASKTYRRIRDADKRWLDKDDLIQDTLVQALEAEQSFREGAGQKYSSHLFTRLQWASGRLHTSLLRGKRTPQTRDADGVPVFLDTVELDAPAGNDSRSWQLADPGAVGRLEDTAIGETQREKAFQRLVQSVEFSPVEKPLRFRAISHLVSVFLFGHRAAVEPEVRETLALAAKNARIVYSDLCGCGTDEKCRKKLLQWAAGYAIMDSGAENKLRCLECVKCSGRFTLADVRAGSYYLEPGMCRSCYRHMQADSGTCFGKEYQRTDSACRLHCPDREVCRDVKKGRIVMGEKNGGAVIDEALGKGLDELDAVEKPKKAKKKTPKAAAVDTVEASGKKKKAEKASVKPDKSGKKAAVAKPVELPAEGDPPAPPEVVEWPFRAGSAKRFCFRACYKGVSKKKFESFFQPGILSAEQKAAGIPQPKLTAEEKASGQKAGPLYGVAQHDFHLKVQRHGANMASWHGGNTLTHTWRFSEEGGHYQIFDVKYVGGKKKKADTSSSDRGSKKNKKAA